MSNDKLFPSFHWFLNLFLVLWNLLAYPFKRTSPPMELPVFSPSPVPPSTPSFIQTYEQNIVPDAMTVFQLNSGFPRASRMARTKLALQAMRNASQGVNKTETISLTDPSPGFSMLSDVVDNFATSAQAESPSLYSSPPSSPSSSLNTPRIIVSTTLGEFPPEDGEPVNPDEIACDAEPPFVAPRDSAGRFEIHPVDYLPDASDLAKRRKFRGPPIVTNIPDDLLFLPARPSTPKNDARQDNCDQHPVLLSPKSALATVTDFVRSSTTPKSPKSPVLREASPECQLAFTLHDPFSTRGDSFYLDDHVPTSPPNIDIQNISLYTKRKGRVTEAEVNDIVFTQRTSTFSHLTEEDISAIEPSFHVTSSVLAPAFALPLPIVSSEILFNYDLDHEPSPDVLKHCDDRRQQSSLSSLETEEMKCILARLSLYASLVFPFSLEDTVLVDDGVGNAMMEADRRPGSPMNQEMSARALPAFDQALEPLPTGPTSSVLATVVTSEVSAARLSPCSGGLTSLKRDLSIVDDLSAVVPNDSLDGDVLESVHDSSWRRKRNRCATIVLPPPRRGHFQARDDRVSLSAPECNMQQSQSVAEVDSGCLEPCSTTLITSPSSLTVAAHSPVSVIDLSPPVIEPPSPSSASEVFSPTSDSTCFDSSFQILTKDDLDGDVFCDVAQDGDYDHVSSGLTDSRARRIGIYGTLPNLETPGAPPVTTRSRSDSVSARQKAIAAERHRASIIYSAQRESKRGSALRPLMLPLRLALRESYESGNPEASESLADLSMQSSLSRIGKPPSMPLPDVPLRKTPSKASLAMSALASKPNAEERLNSLLDLMEAMNVTNSDADLGSPSELSTPAMDSSMVSSPTSEADSWDDDDANSSVIWGIAF